MTMPNGLSNFCKRYSLGVWVYMDFKERRNVSQACRGLKPWHACCSELFILFVFGCPFSFISLISFLTFQLDEEGFRREIWLQMDIQIYAVFLNRVLFKTFNGEVFNQFLRAGNAIQEFYNLPVQLFAGAGIEIFKSAAV